MPTSRIPAFEPAAKSAHRNDCKQAKTKHAQERVPSEESAACDPREPDICLRLTCKCKGAENHEISHGSA